MDIHPFITHFPIVLLLTGTICETVAYISKRAFYARMGHLLFAIGALTAIPAALSGDYAAETAQHIPTIAEDLDDHDTLGTAATLLAVVLALLRTHLTFKNQFTGTLRQIYLILALVTTGLICAAGYTGGYLVYTYGAGTTPVIKSLDISPQETERIPRTNTFENQ